MMSCFVRPRGCEYNQTQTTGFSFTAGKRPTQGLQNGIIAKVMDEY